MDNGRTAAECIEIRYGLEQFRTDWRRLALSSDFLGETAAQACYAQRVVSSAVNELLELVYRLGANSGSAALSVTHRADELELELRLPLDPESARRVSAEVARLNDADPQRLYIEQLGQSQPTSTLFGVLYLMADFGARIVAATGPEGLRLTVLLSTAEGGQA